MAQSEPALKSCNLINPKQHLILNTFVTFIWLSINSTADKSHKDENA